MSILMSILMSMLDEHAEDELDVHTDGAYQESRTVVDTHMAG